MTRAPPGAEADEAIVRAIDRAIAPLSGKLEQVFQMGSPTIRRNITEQIRRDQQRSLLLALVVLVVTLAPRGVAI